MDATTPLTGPKSPLCADALTLAQTVEPEFLLNHSLRTFHYADLIGKEAGIRFDEELLFVAATLHDVGLAARFDGPQRFEVEGADAARALCHKHGLSPERASIVWDAIALHTSDGISSQKGPECALLALGASADFVGEGLEPLETATLDAIGARYPRLGFGRRFMSLVAQQVERNPEKAPPFSLPAEIARCCIDGYEPPTFVELLSSSPYDDCSGV